MLLICLGLIAGCGNKDEKIQLVELTTNNKIDLLGIDKNPYFGWKMISEENEKSQEAYQIRVAKNKKKLKRGKLVWDSGKVDSEISVAIPYEGMELEAEQKYVWDVRAWDGNGQKVQSESASFEMGKLEEVWEETKWITAPVEDETFLYTDDYKVAEINFDFKMEQMEAGFIWSAKEAGYGTQQRLGFSVADGEVNVGISYQDGDEILASFTSEMEQWDVEDFLAAEHHVCIKIQGNIADVYVDGVQVLVEVPVESCYIGSIGFYAARDEKKAWCDNIVIKN